MLILKKASDLTQLIDRKRQRGGSIGFVPTMGALHGGHLQLLEHAKKKAHFVVCSIYVNPTQFNNPVDFAAYPITIENDILSLEKAGCDLLYLPNTSEMYPTGLDSLERYQLGVLEKLWEGWYRPGHFQGVCQVVNRLLSAVQPDFLFLGQKDLQQCKMIQRLLHTTKQNTELIIVPTVRAPSGLAMSSRNLRLTADALNKAASLFRVLNYTANGIKVGSNEALIGEAKKNLIEAGFESVDYLAIVDKNDMTDCTYWNGKTAYSIIAAAYIEGVRLIDNIP